MSLINHHLTIHIRLTKHCNADCGYCSSVEASASDALAMDERMFEIAIERLQALIIKRYRHGESVALMVQYVGGELLYLPFDYIERSITLVREKLSGLFGEFKDGGQTNLTGSAKKVNQLYDLFEGRVGTSVDSFTAQRTLGGSEKRYRTIFLKRHEDLASKGKVVPAVTLINKVSAATIDGELDIANAKGYPLTFRHEFSGGSGGETMLPADELAVIYRNLFTKWVMNSAIPVEPFYRLFSSYLDLTANTAGCAFDRDCANNSLNLEPNGDLFLCQEMADMKINRLGNLFTDSFDSAVWDRISNRVKRIHSDCLVCPYFKACRGGCMAEAMGEGQDEYGKPSSCASWTAIFKEMDSAVEHYGQQPIVEWLAKIDGDN